MNRAVFVLGTLLLQHLVAMGGDPTEVHGAGAWGSRSVYLWPGPTAIGDQPAEGRTAHVSSPDHTKTLEVRDEKLFVTSAVGPAIAAPTAIGSLAEVQWAPSSDAFVVTQSDGGWVGTWGASVFMFSHGKLDTVELSQAVAASFQARPGGCTEETPNVGAIAWLGPRALLVAAEAPPHSSCRDMAAIRGFEVSIPSGRIVRQYDEPTLRKDYASVLGSRLKGTPK